jgi:phosphoribosylformylglycinamidine cyclo-ligase
MLRTFNCGIGLTVIVAPEKADDAIAAFNDNGEHATKIGTLVAGEGEGTVRYRGALKL